MTEFDLPATALLEYIREHAGCTLDEFRDSYFGTDLSNDERVCVNEKLWSRAAYMMRRGLIARDDKFAIHTKGTWRVTDKADSIKPMRNHVSEGELLDYLHTCKWATTSDVLTDCYSYTKEDMLDRKKLSIALNNVRHRLKTLEVKGLVRSERPENNGPRIWIKVE